LQNQRGHVIFQTSQSYAVYVSHFHKLLAPALRENHYIARWLQHVNEIAQGRQQSSGAAAAADDDDGWSKNAGLVRIWVAMQTTLCSKSAISEDMISKSSRNINLGS